MRNPHLLALELSHQVEIPLVWLLRASNSLATKLVGYHFLDLNDPFAFRYYIRLYERTDTGAFRLSTILTFQAASTIDAPTFVIHFSSP